MAKFREGDKVRVAVTTIQRPNGAAWRDDRGEVKRVAGGKYAVEFSGGFRAENVSVSRSPWKLRWRSPT